MYGDGGDPMPYVYEIEVLEALRRISAELPELTKALYQLLEELRALRRSIEEARLEKRL